VVNARPGSHRLVHAPRILLFDCYIEILIVGFNRLPVLGAAPSPSVSLHGSTSITLGVPDVETVSRYYEEFGRRAARSAAANDVKGELL
jgi:hypothetical protein